MLKIDEYFWIKSSFGSVEPAGTVFRTQKLENFGSSSSFEAALILVLLGFSDVLDASGKVLVRPRKNLGVSGAPIVTGSRRALLVAANNIGLDFDVINHYLQKAHAQQSYYKELLLEVLHYLRRTKQGQHSMAFLHLYRFLERVSYVFPITYALRSDNFKGTYESFKAYISGDKTGELKFFQKFQFAVIEEAVRESSMKFDFQSLPYGGEATGYRLIKKFSSANYLVSDTSDLEVTIEGQGVIELVVNLRNRFFHAGSGHVDNVSLLDLPDPDGFFGRVNENFISWLAIVYFQTLIAKADRYN
jgi:hypothetical protein